MVRKVSWGVEDHKLDWLEEFPVVEHSRDPIVRDAVNSINLRKQKLKCGGNNEQQRKY